LAIKMFRPPVVIWVNYTVANQV